MNTSAKTWQEIQSHFCVLETLNSTLTIERRRITICKLHIQGTSRFDATLITPASATNAKRRDWRKRWYSKKLRIRSSILIASGVSIKPQACDEGNTVLQMAPNTANGNSNGTNGHSQSAYRPPATGADNRWNNTTRPYSESDVKKLRGVLSHLP